MTVQVTDIPLALYIHFPWCVRKCPYCDFNSHESGDSQERGAGGALSDDLQQAYVRCLNQDLQAELETVRNRSISSIFLGGGTPSLFNPKHLKALLGRISDNVDLSDDIEITMETNPGTAEYWQFEDYRDAGINRLSLGAQSFNADSLNQLGRIHAPEHIVLAVNKARAGGFENINLDLMYGLPSQDMDAALADIRAAVSLEPTHLSWYQLTIEPNTYFYRHPPVQPSDDMLADISDEGIKLLAAEGYARYEVSAYSRQRVCRHNVNYWQFGDYLGIGAGAHGNVSMYEAIIRRWKTRLPKDYIAHYHEASGQLPAGFRQAQIPNSELPLEFLMNALRLTDGFDLALFNARTGLSAEVLAPFLEQGKARGLLKVERNTIRPTARGMLFLDELLALV